MKIRNTQLHEIDTVMKIYEDAKLFMQKTGNANQWIDGYPHRELIITEIEKQRNYVCIDSDNEIVGVFTFTQGADPNYAVIYHGKWLSDAPYGVIHRLAGTGKGKGVASFCLAWCYRQCPNIRVDTHGENRIMQNILKNNGFTECGIILVANGTERIAYQKC